MDTVGMWIGLLAGTGLFLYMKLAAKPPEPNPEIVCPHCQKKGTVICTRVARKKVVSGGKATGALLTGGVSMLATGLSRKEGATHMHCQNCQTQWDVI